MKNVAVPPRVLLRGRLFWTCAAALALGVLFVLFPRLPASLEVVSAAGLVVLLASAINQMAGPQSG